MNIHIIRSQKCKSKNSEHCLNRRWLEFSVTSNYKIICLTLIYCICVIVIFWNPRFFITYMYMYAQVTFDKFYPSSMQFQIYCFFVLMNKMIVLLKGVLIGGIVGIFITLWLCIGSLTVRYTYPLPPVSVQQCYPRNGTYTFSTQTLTNYTSFEVFDRTGAMDSWEQTTEILAGRRQAVRNITKNHRIMLWQNTLRRGEFNE